MADWAHVPSFNYRIRYDGPQTLVTRYEDGKESRREKSGNVPRIFRERHSVNGTTMDTMLDFYDTNTMESTFTKVSYDPKEVVDTEATVRFLRPPQLDIVAGDRYHAEFEFIEVF